MQATAGSTDTERIRHVLQDTQSPDIGALWEICSYYEWENREKTVDSISAWLGAPGSVRLLDCACGSGFPAIDLAARGYDVTCSDGSARMLELFHRNAAERGVDLRADLVRWEELSGHHGTAAFDVVMCRGCSLLYAGTWDADARPNRKVLVDALRQFVACVRPCGRLYIDTARGDDLDRRDALWSPVRELRVDSHHLELREVVVNRPNESTRMWRSWLTIDGVTHEFARSSHYLRTEELIELLGEAGLSDVHREHIEGEHYEVIVGRRPR